MAQAMDLTASYSAEKSRGVVVNPDAERQFIAQMQQVATVKRQEANYLALCG